MATEIEMIEHHGIIGQKWGVRRYQNKDGSLTSAGKKRVEKLKGELDKLEPSKKESSSGQNEKITSKQASVPKKATKPATKSLSEMSNAEIQAKIDRINLETRYKALTAPQKSRGKRMMETIGKNAGKVITERATKVAGDMLEKKLRSALHVSQNNNNNQNRNNDDERRRRGN